MTPLKELNLTAAGYSDSRALLGDGMDFLFSVAGRPLLAAFRLAEPAGSTAAGLRVTRLDGAGFRFRLRHPALFRRGDYDFGYASMTTRTQVPNAKFVFVYEGASLPYMYNGD